MGILSLSDGEVLVVEQIKSFKAPEENGGWVAYLKEEMKKDPDKKEKIEEKEEGEKPKEENKEGEGKRQKIRNSTGPALSYRWQRNSLRIGLGLPVHKEWDAHCFTRSPTKRIRIRMGYMRLAR